VVVQGSFIDVPFQGLKPPAHPAEQATAKAKMQGSLHCTAQKARGSGRDDMVWVMRTVG
jgi:hypothetical protein